MNREILFKGKHSHALPQNAHLDGSWIEGYLADKNYINSPELEGEFLIDENTVCQYTGLNDKNGRKIFEGDIVQEYPFKAVVRFGEFENQVLKNIGFNLDWLNIAYYRQDLLYWIDKIEVIGNIFDNPELVKEAGI